MFRRLASSGLSTCSVPSGLRQRFTEEAGRLSAYTCSVSTPQKPAGFPLGSRWVPAGLWLGFPVTYDDYSTCSCSLSTLRCENCRRLASERALPSNVLGPVLRPPCHLQRLFPGSLRAWHGFPSRRRRAPQGLRSSTRSAHSQSRPRRRNSVCVHPNLFMRARVGAPACVMYRAFFNWALLVIEHFREFSGVKPAGGQAGDGVEWGAADSVPMHSLPVGATLCAFHGMSLDERAATRSWGNYSRVPFRCFPICQRP